ncbi:hypothetical protein BpHYR1_018888 [Brachionus plicatilis]|uniref:Uncharacterized protein n=1 Tax=Brachionus plicatilis TaxID=10195 RepID=A0A3M7R5N1_BRAPC|nr:hypothetical protein BpHYR1_018888 [Brachionus plicatilis]
MSSDEEEYDIMAPRRKSTLNYGARLSSLLDDEPSLPSNHIINIFRSNISNKPQFSQDSEGNNDSDNGDEAKPTKNFFDDITEKKEDILDHDKAFEPITRKYTNENIESPKMFNDILLNSNKLAEPELKSTTPEPRYSTQQSDALRKESELKSSRILLNNIYHQNSDDQKSNIPSIIENLNLKTKLSRTSTDLKLISEKYENKPEFKETIDRFLLNKPFWFDLYKNKRDKINLLNEAIKSSDGNAILAQINDKDQLLALEKFQENQTEIANILSFNRVICDRSLDLSKKMKLFYDFERNFSLNEINQIKSSRVYEAAWKHLTLLKIQKEILSE